MKKYFIAFLLLFGFECTYSQVTFEAKVMNQQVIGTDFYFDIYLTRTGTNDLYLGNVDFILTFNSAAFTSPSISVEAVGYWNLVSPDLSSVGSVYRNNTAPTISGNQIQIIVGSPTPGTQAGFDGGVAKINNTANTHRVGRYKVSGISNSSSAMNLQWVLAEAPNPSCKVFTLATSTPWTSTEATGTWTNPESEPLPVELTSFTSTVVKNAVTLTWQTATEINNYGFEIERATKNEWEKIGFIHGHGNSDSDKTYNFIDKNPGYGEFSYRLKQIDIDGSFEYSNVINVTIGEQPVDFVLRQNYPNPFNPTTIISYELPEPSFVNLSVYNVIGEKVAELVNDHQETGKYNQTFDAGRMTSGIYIYVIKIGNNILQRKMTLLK